MSKGWQVGVVVLAVALVAALGALSGCGGDEESTAGTGGPVAAGADDDGAGAAGNGAGGGNGGDSGGGEAFGSAEEPVGGGTEGEGSSGGGTGGEGGANGDPQGRPGKSGLGGRTAKNRSAKKRRGQKGAGGEGAPAAASDSAFFEQADAICREAEANTRANFGKYLDGKKGLDAIGMASEDIVNELVIPGLEGAMRDITALNPPASASGAVAALFDSYEKVIGAAKANAEQLILQGDVAVQSEEEAKQNGFQVCGGI